MKTGRIVLFLIVLSILWCADVFAHNDGNPVAHFCPGDPGRSVHGVASTCRRWGIKVDTGMLCKQMS